MVLAPGELLWWAPWAITVIDDELADALVHARGGVIVAVEQGVTRQQALERGAECFDQCVLAPGFVNAHSHIEYAAYDALTDGMPFPEWIADHMRRKQRLQPTHMRASAELGAWQAAAGGVTCLGDASFSGDAAHALHTVGLRGRVYLELFGTDDGHAIVERCLARLAQLPRSDLLQHGVSPHAPYSVSAQVYAAVAATDLPWMTHLLETAAEADAVTSGTGPLADRQRAHGHEPRPWPAPPVDVLAPLLGPHVVAVHCVHATARDVGVLAATGVGIAHCPRSNARLGCGVLDLATLERTGATVGLGTDSPASAGAIDMFAEMRSAIELHRATGGDATWPSARRALRMATHDAAHVLGYDNGLGTLAADAPADIVACHTGATQSPLNVYVLGCGPGDVRATAVAGNVVWRHDRNDLRRATQRAADARALLELPTRSPAYQH